MTAIKIVKECHLVTTAVVGSPVPSEYTTLALPLSEKKKRSAIPELRSCTVAALPLLFSYITFNSSDYIKFSNNDSDK